MAEDEATDALVALRRIVRSLRLADREAEVACGLSAAQLFVLETLATAPNISQAELAARTLTDQSSVSTVVAKLVEREYVSRTVAKSDRRRTELALTAAGKQVLARAPEAPQRAMISAIRAMPAARRAALVRSLGDLATILGADRLAPRMLFDDEPRKPKRR
jgi:DNA-binding MarR family transcriptional regulator